MGILVINPHKIRYYEQKVSAIEIKQHLLAGHHSKPWRRRLGDWLLSRRLPWLMRNFYHFRPPRIPSVAAFLAIYARQTNQPQPVCFVQVGAHAGGVRDPLFRHVILDDWRGIFVEPQPQTFQALKQFYQGIPQLTFVNQAISDHFGSVRLHQLCSEQLLPAWASQLTSVEQRVPAQLIAQLPKTTLEIVVAPCTTLQQLLCEHHFPQVDVLLVDTEEHDAVVLASLDWAHYRPAVVIYEYCHLLPADEASTQELLTSNAYHLWRGRFNTIAVQDEKLLAGWSDL